MSTATMQTTTRFTRETAPVIANTGNYSHLRALRPEAYLRPENFVTCFDSLEGNIANGQGEKQYRAGLEIGAKSREVFITANGTWGADSLDGSYTTSYEGIGYHAGTAQLLRGFLDSGVTIRIHRMGDAHGTLIQVRP